MTELINQTRKGISGHRFIPDTGCRLAPKCLECPFPLDDKGRCMLDWPVHQMEKSHRNERIRTLAPQHTTAELAQMFGIAERSVLRIVHDN